MYKIENPINLPECLKIDWEKVIKIPKPTIGISITDIEVAAEKALKLHYEYFRFSNATYRVLPGGQITKITEWKSGDQIEKLVFEHINWRPG